MICVFCVLMFENDPCYLVHLTNSSLLGSLISIIFISVSILKRALRHETSPQRILKECQLKQRSTPRGRDGGEVAPFLAGALPIVTDSQTYQYVLHINERERVCSKRLCAGSGNGCVAEGYCTEGRCFNNLASRICCYLKTQRLRERLSGNTIYH